MERLTIRLPEDLAEHIEDMADENGVSQSEAARRLIRRGTEYDDLRDERDRLRRQLSATNRRVDEHTELVEFVDEQRELDRRKHRRRTAPVWTRAKWWLLGEPDEE